MRRVKVRWRLLGLLASLMVTAGVRAQYYSTGSDPLRMKWHTVSGRQWEIYADQPAIEWAAAANEHLDSITQKEGKDYSDTKIRRKVPIVLHSRTAYSNGLVSLAPMRLEAYTFDTGEEDRVPWISHLMTHEWRHVLQTETVRRGFTKGLSYVFGQQTTGAVLGLFCPRWYLEGDAVWAETEYTSGGRGRNPIFLQQMRAQVTAGRTPSYSQAYFGSYKRFVPDYYHMGYYTVSAVSEEFGWDTWRKALENVGRRPFTIVAFNRTLRQGTGMRKMAAYRWAMGQWGEKWEKEKGDSKESGVEKVEKKVREMSEWKAERYYEEVVEAKRYKDGLIAYITSPAKVGHFAYIDKEGKRHYMFATGLRADKSFSIKGDTMIWTETRTGLIGEHNRHSVLMKTDLRRNSTKRIEAKSAEGHEENYYKPRTNSEGRTAAIGIDESQRNRIVMPLEESGREVMTVKIGEQISDIEWADSRTMIAVVLQADGKHIVEIDTESGAKTELISPEHFGKEDEPKSIRNITSEGNHIYFTADIGGYSDIYRVDRETLKCERLTTARNGADYATICDGELIYSEYTATGFSLCRRKIDAEEVGLFRREKWEEGSESREGREVEARRRRGIGIHLKPNIHSWGPAVVDANNATIGTGVAIASQNPHGTVTWQAGLSIEPEEEDSRLFANVNWNFLPVRLSLTAKVGKEEYQETLMSIDTVRNGAIETTTLEIDDNIRKSNIQTSAYLPLKFSRLAWEFRVTPQMLVHVEREGDVTYKQTQVRRWGSRGGYQRLSTNEYKLKGKDYVCYTPALTFSATRRMADRDVNYRAGITVRGMYDISPNYGRMLTGEATIYLPGFWRHHSIVLYGGIQKKEKGDEVEIMSGLTTWRTLSERIGAPVTLATVSNLRNELYTAQYQMPIVNPDIEIGPIAYIKRVTAAPFVSVGRSKLWDGRVVVKDLKRSVCGVRLQAETYLLGLPYPINIGVMACRRTETKDWVFRPLLTMTIR